MTALISLLVIVTLSLLTTRIVTTALALTGLSRQAAHLQAASAFTGVGFTTSESEQIVNHPVRRRILLITMILGNAGVVTSVSSLVLTFVGTGRRDFLIRLLLLMVGLAALWVAASSQRLDHYLSRLIGWALDRWTDLNIRDYASLLKLSGDYRVMEIQVEQGDWLVGKTLAQVELGREGVLVLGITREDGNYVGAPVGETDIRPGDTLILYGRGPALAELDDRLAGAVGDQAHQAAIDKQEKVLEEQAREDESDQQKKGAG